VKKAALKKSSSRSSLKYFLLLITAFFLFSPFMEAQETNIYTFAEERSVIPNPERGWYISTETENINERELASLRRRDITMIMMESNLEEFLAEPIGKAKLDEIERAFSYARRAGLSVIFRAAYDFSGDEKPEPVELRTILGHIQQLGPVFSRNEDILYSVQAGFLGPWGEWHSSRFGEKIWPIIQRQIAYALLEAVPADITVALRRPEYIRTVTNNQKLTQNEAFSGSRLSRLAFHDDAILSDETDMDTYSDPSKTRNAELEWINNHTRYTPLVAEANTPSKYNDSGNAVELLDYMNLQSLNMTYHPDIMEKWRKTSYGGMSTFDYIGMMMGYRFVLNRAEISKTASQGGAFTLKLNLVNTGFGSLMKKKNFEIILKNGDQLYRAAISDDPRLWRKKEPVSRSFSFRLPSDIPPGNWDIYLNLTSADDSLRRNSAYSVRFSNKDVWDPGLGMNKIGAIQLTASANPGNETEFRQIGQSSR